MKLSTSILLAGVFLMLAPNTYAQTRTIRLMQYNLLNYGNSANPTSYKDPRLTGILQYVQPDIFGANEIRNDSTLCDHILTDILGQGWKRGYYSNTNNETQTNMLFWNSGLFGYRGQDIVCSNLRDIVAYRLYYKDTVTTAHDTTNLTVIVAHLKASGGSSDEADRAAETQEVVNYLNNINQPGNYIFMGDLNLYSSTEQAYQNLIANTNANGHMNDPINRPGDWHDNSNFADIHTQSPRTTTTGDGGVTGGLDDRFDIMLVSDPVMNDARGAQYVTGSYTVIGQDGQHFNMALTDLPTNTAAPANIIQALYEMSDHLPIRADFLFHPVVPANAIADPLFLANHISVINPFSDQIMIRLRGMPSSGTLHCTLYNISGQKILEQQVTADRSPIILTPVQDLPEGMYMLQVTDDIHLPVYCKLVRL